MAERYVRVFTFEKSFFQENVPVLVKAGALLHDRKTGEILAQVKFKNIGSKVIKALKVGFVQKDTAGNLLGEIDEFSYLDISVDRDGEFGEKTPVKMSDKNTRAYEVYIKQVVFSDGTVENVNTKQMQELPKQQTVTEYLNSEELAGWFREKTATDCCYVPKKMENFWMCACGALNRKDEVKCHTCKNSFDELMANLNVNELSKELKAKQMETEYQSAIRSARENTIESLEMAIDKALLIMEYKDTKQLVEGWKKQLEELRDTANKEAKKRRTFIGVGIVVFVLALIMFAGKSEQSVKNRQDNLYNQLVGTKWEGSDRHDYTYFVSRTKVSIKFHSDNVTISVDDKYDYPGSSDDVSWSGTETFLWKVQTSGKDRATIQIYSEDGRAYSNIPDDKIFVTFDEDGNITSFESAVPGAAKRDMDYERQ